LNDPLDLGGEIRCRVADPRRTVDHVPRPFVGRTDAVEHGADLRAGSHRQIGRQDRNAADIAEQPFGFLEGPPRVVESFLTKAPDLSVISSKMPRG
jgi:hypothetical protein